MNLKIIIEPDEDVWTVYCPQLPGCVSYGKTKEDAFFNIREAIELYLRPAPGVFDKLPGDGNCGNRRLMVEKTPRVNADEIIRVLR